MVIGIGIDLCKISRIERALQFEHFKTKIFTPEEISYCEAKGPESYAASFAAREAFCKASNTPLMLAMNSVSLSRENGRPSIKLSGELATFSGKIHVSISHEGDYACAMVVIEE